MVCEFYKIIDYKIITDGNYIFVILVKRLCCGERFLLYVHVFNKYSWQNILNDSFKSVSLVIIEMGWWRDFVRQRTKPIPYDHAFKMKKRLSGWYFFFSWNALSLCAYVLFKQRNPMESEDQNDKSTASNLSTNRNIF